MEPASLPRLQLHLIRLHEFYDQAAENWTPCLAWYGQSEIVGIVDFEASADLYRVYLADGTTHTITGRKWVYLLTWHSSQQGGAL